MSGIEGAFGPVIASVLASSPPDAGSTAAAALAHWRRPARSVRHLRAVCHSCAAPVPEHAGRDHRREPSAVSCVHVRSPMPPGVPFASCRGDQARSAASVPELALCARRRTESEPDGTRVSCAAAHADDFRRSAPVRRTAISPSDQLIQPDICWSQLLSERLDDREQLTRHFESRPSGLR